MGKRGRICKFMGVYKRREKLPDDLWRVSVIEKQRYEGNCERGKGQGCGGEGRGEDKGRKKRNSQKREMEEMH